ncbi:unnamed protein product [Alternaria alternata]
MGEIKPVQLALEKIASEFTSHKFSFISLNFVESEAQKYGRPRLAGEADCTMSLPNETTVSVKQKMNDIFESAHMMKMKSFFDDVLESVKARKRQQCESMESW